MGHIKTVADLQNTLSLDQIRWVLSARPPHRGQTGATIEQRLAMLELALADYSTMVCDDIEAKRNRPSYTIETLEYFRAEFSDSSLILIVGSDIVQTFDQWHRYREILDFAHIIVMQRAGYDSEVTGYLAPYVSEDFIELRQMKAGKVFIYPAPQVAISATKIRTKIAEQKDVSELLSPEVQQYIEQNQLYHVTHKTNSTQNDQPLTQEENMLEMQAEIDSVPMSFNSEEQKNLIVDALEDSKALDIKVLEIADIASFADYMIVATGTSNTHLRAIANNSVRDLSKKGLKPLGEEGQDSNEWVLVDFGDVVVNIMRAEVREFYELEKLWDKEVRKVLDTQSV